MVPRLIFPRNPPAAVMALVVSSCVFHPRELVEPECTVQVDEACASHSAECGEVTTIDSCGEEVEVGCGGCPSFHETCGGDGQLNRCGHDLWFGVAGSDFGRWHVRIEWSSATGGGISSDYQVGGHSVAIDAAGRAVAVWRGAGDTYRKVHVKQLVDGSWIELGSGSARGDGISPTVGPSDAPAVVIDGQGRPVVVWRQYATDATYQIFVRRFDGSSWEEVGAGSASGHGISDSTLRPYRPKLAVDGDGHPILAWNEGAVLAMDIRVKRFDGSVWADVGADPVVVGTGDDHVLMVDGNGRPILAWADRTPGLSQIYVKRFDSVWQELAGSASSGGVSDTAVAARYPAVATDGQGRLIVAWVSDSTHIHAKRYDGSSWCELGVGSASGGGVSDTAGPTNGPSVVVDDNDRVIVAWGDRSDGVSHIYAKMFDGTAWAEVGNGSASGSGISMTRGPAGGPRLVLGDLGQVVVSWYESSVGQVYGRQLVSGRWEVLNEGNASGGGVSDSDQRSELPALASNGSDDLLVVWSELGPSGRDIRSRLFDRVSWREPCGGAPNAPGAVRMHADAVYSAAGEPVVAWVDTGPTPSQVYVKRCSDNTWQEMGPGSASGTGVSAGTVRARDPSLTVAPDGSIVMAWFAGPDGSQGEIYVKRFDGTGWGEAGSGSATDGGISNSGGLARTPSVEVDDLGRVVVVWCHGMTGEIHVRRFSGTAWEEIGPGSASGGGISNTPDLSWEPTVAIDATGAPVVAWEEMTSAAWQIYVKRFDGVSWAELPFGSATGPGLSNSAGHSRNPTLRRDSNGDLVIAWQESTLWSDEIFVKRFDGTVWVDMPTGSGSSHGVSNSAVDSRNPAVVAHGVLVCVAWQELGRLDQEIVLRCTEE